MLHFGVNTQVLNLKFWLRCDSPQEVFYLTYTPDDVEGNLHLDTGDKVSFYMETNKQ